MLLQQRTPTGMPKRVLYNLTGQHQQWISCMCLHFLHCWHCLNLFLFITLQEPQVSGAFSLRREGWSVTYHSDADGIIKLVHEDTDDSRRQQQQDERVFELAKDRMICTFTGIVLVILINKLIVYSVNDPGHFFFWPVLQIENN